MENSNVTPLVPKEKTEQESQKIIQQLQSIKQQALLPNCSPVNQKTLNNQDNLLREFCVNPKFDKIRYY